ncbi:MAG: hypothetical protein CME64_07100 [Halobacteriovoraceae bacterium]|nr:hypothetical protein [Halobacteriovoraceae bacterium]
MNDQIRSTFLKLLFIGLISSGFANASSPVKSLTETSIDKLLKKRTLSVSRSEQRLGHNLAKLYEIAEKGYFNQRLAKKLLKQTKGHPTFSIYKAWLKSMISIQTNKSAKALQAVCSKMTNQSFENLLEEELGNQATTMCFNQYLKLLSRNSKSFAGKKRQVEFFKKHAKWVSHNSNIESLNYLLSRFKNSPKTLKEYSLGLTSYFMKSEQVPPKSLLQYMDITPELTRYIQVKGLDQNSSKYVLYRELKKLIKKTFNAADSNKPIKEITKLLSEALNYYKLSYPHLPKYKANKRILSLGKSLTRRSHFEAARQAFSAILEQNPNDENVIYEKMWTWVTQENYSKAISRVVKPYKLDEKFKSLKDERLQFWVAYSMKEKGIDEHLEVFEDLVTKSPLNYYSILAAKLLAEEKEEAADKLYFKLANQNSSTPQKMPDLDQKSTYALKRLKIWGSLDFKPFIKLEYKSIFKTHSRSIAQNNESHDLGQSQASMILLASSILKEEKNYLESFKIIYRGLNRKLISLDEEVLNVLFPRPFLNQVSKYSKGYDPLIALSLIRQESGFNSRARSWVGARGLMQLMPKTARMYWRGIKTRHLYNPKINIKIGSKYLKKLMTQYDHNLVYALSAYNAGESRVKKWRKEYLTHEGSILHNIENIPFPETRKYVKLIYRNLFFYKMMDKKTELADSTKVNKIFDVSIGFNAD